MADITSNLDIQNLLSNLSNINNNNTNNSTNSNTNSNINSITNTNNSNNGQNNDDIQKKDRIGLDLFVPNSKNLKWDAAIEEIFMELADESQINSFLHKRAHQFFKYKNMKYQLPVILFSALSGSGNFISTYFPENMDTIVLAIGFVSILISIVSSLAQYFKLSELAEGNRISYLAWEKFHINIKFQLRRKRDSRENIQEFLNQIVPEYQRLKEISPEIPESIVKELRKKKNFSKMKVPSSFNGFHPIVPYITQNDVITDEIELRDLGHIRNSIDLSSRYNGVAPHQNTTNELSRLNHYNNYINTNNTHNTHNMNTRISTSILGETTL